MTTVKTLNLKGMEHEALENLLFPALEELRTGEKIEVVLEFNPLPLLYTLKAGGEFRIRYLSEGPGEWALELTREAQPADQKERLKELLRMLRSEELSEAGKEQARGLLRVLDASTLGLLEQELIHEGITQEEIRTHLCDLHLEVLRESLAAQRIQVESPHPIHTLMAEHQAILAILTELGGVAESLKTRRGFEQAARETARLPALARDLLDAESHHQREEQVIFPLLEKHGIHEPPAIMRADHEAFRRRKGRLSQLAEAARNPKSLDFGLWRCEVVDLAEYLERELESHIFKEDNILYQMALQAFTPEEWEAVKRDCDRLGYSCFSPAVQPITLDMHSVPLLQRQAKVMATWKDLPAGRTLRLQYDREPRPIQDLFQATQRGRFEWSYEQEGPDEWVAEIRKL